MMKLNPQDFQVVKKLAGELQQPSGQLACSACGGKHELDECDYTQPVDDFIKKALTLIYEHSLVNMPNDGGVEIVVYKVDPVKTNKKMEIGRRIIPKAVWEAHGTTAQKSEVVLIAKKDIVANYNYLEKTTLEEGKALEDYHSYKSMKQAIINQQTAQNQLTDSILGALGAAGMGTGLLGGGMVGGIANNAAAKTLATNTGMSEIMLQKIAVAQAEYDTAVVTLSPHALMYGQKLAALKQSAQATQQATQQANKVSSTLGTYYNKKVLDNLKAQTPFLAMAKTPSFSNSKPAPVYTPPKPDPTEGFVSVVSSEQKFVQHLGMRSDCNVCVQTKGETWNPVSRLLCEKCNASLICKQEWIKIWNYNQPEVIEFCKAHKHAVVAREAPSGRKFRV